MSIEVDKHKVIRDLRWLLTSPNVMNSEYPNLPESIQHRLVQQLDVLKKRITDPTKIKVRKRLGFYVEDLFLWLLTLHPEFELIEHSIQLINQKQTIGELDFLVYDCVERRYLHIELAVKFYLLKGDDNGLHNWIGPNKKDRLDKKLERIIQHQLKLSNHPLLKKQLPNVANAQFKSYMLFKGRMFHHSSSIENRSALFNKALEIDEWKRIGELTHAESRRLAVLEKVDWLAPIYAANTAPLLNNFISNAQIMERPLMCWDSEQKRCCFIVPENW